MIKKFIGLFSVLSIILAICSCAPVTIDTVPPDAAVYSADGQTQLGPTPFDTRVFVGNKTFTVRKERYFDQPVKLDYNAPRNVAVKLSPVPVTVQSTPSAGIYQAGSDIAIGHTPMKVAVLDKAVTYTLKAKDYYDKEIIVGSDSPDPIVVELARRPIVTISAEPEGVGIYENDKLIGTAPVREEILTPRTFELRKAGYFTQGGTLVGAPPYEIHGVLRPFPVITVTATPAGAQISRDGGLIGKDSVKLSVGDKTVLEVRADRFYMQNVTITPDSVSPVNVALKAMPYVMIGSQPAGAEVFVAGKSIGTTPVEQLIEKDTVIELRKEGFVTKTATLTGADKQVTVTLEAVPVPEPVQTQAVSEVKSAKSGVSAQAAEPAAKKGNSLLIAGIAVAAVVLAALILLKRKKK
jgi:hypothetical protein